MEVILEDLPVLNTLMEVRRDLTTVAGFTKPFVPVAEGTMTFLRLPAPSPKPTTAATVT
jgi:hypothetical protein